MKKIHFLFILLLIIISCDNKINRTNNIIKIKIDTLLVNANNDKFTKSERLKFIDSVSNFNKQIKNDSLFKYYEFKIANRYYNLDLFDKYKSKSIELLKIAIKDNDIPSITKCYYNLGGFYYEKYNIDSSFYYYNKAKRLINPKTNKNTCINIYVDLGRILIYNNQFLEAEKNISKALKLANDENIIESKIECYSLLGLSQLGLRNFNQANIYFINSKKEIDKIKKNYYFPVLKAQNYINLCNLYYTVKDYKKLYLYSKKGLDIKNLKSLEISTFTYLNNYYGYAKFKLKDNSCFKNFKLSLKIGDSLKFEPIQNTSKLHLGEFYLSIKDSLKSNKFLKEVYKSKLIDDRIKAINLLSKSDPKYATTYFENYKTLSDSLINAERQTRDKFARIEYETDEIINQKEAVQKENQIINQRFWSVITVTIIILLIVLILYLVKSRNIKQKELQFVQEQQEAKEEIYELMLNQQHRIEEGKYLEKRRVSQELHDGIMGKLTAIRLNLFVLKKRKDPETVEKCLPFIDDIQTIEKEIRQIAHDLNQNLFDDNVTFISIVENLFTLISNHSDTQFKLFVDERIDWDLIPNTTKINVYRIIQEALQNIEKYAKASLVTLNMKKEGENINITIEDNGVGFDSTIKKKGIGLENMENRMQEIHGTFTIESKIKKGTKINLLFPI